ncbi:MAG: DnaJ C-terminal domain-containing protein [Actinomycetota bacterium]
MSGEIKREWLENDYYAVLGVSESASHAEITKAYRKLARQFHPDANPGDQAAEERFKEISAAYDVVGDEQTRQDYDHARRLGPMAGGFGGGPGGFDFNSGQMGDLGDILGSMFGGGIFGQGRGGQRPVRGRDQEARISISFDEAVRGTTTSLSLSDSSGGRTMKVRIPAGVESGQRIRLRGKGGPGSPPGDLYVIVSVADHVRFGRDGDRLTLTVPITFAEAALGADIDVPTYAGDPVTVRIPAGTQHGRTLRVRGGGVPDEKGDGAGDLLVTVEVAVPKNLTRAQRDALEAFAEASDESPRRHLLAESDRAST